MRILFVLIIALLLAVPTFGQDVLLPEDGDWEIKFTNGQMVCGGLAQTVDSSSQVYKLVFTDSVKMYVSGDADIVLKMTKNGRYQFANSDGNRSAILFLDPDSPRYARGEFVSSSVTGLLDCTLTYEVTGEKLDDPVTLEEYLNS